MCTYVVVYTCAGGVVYIFVYVVLLYIWYFVHVIHVVLCICATMYVHCVVVVS